MTLKESIKPYFEPAITGDTYYQNKLIKAIRPFVIDHLKYRFWCPDSWVDDIAQEVLISISKTIRRGKLKYNGCSAYIFKATRSRYIDWYWWYIKNILIDVEMVPKRKMAVMPDYPLQSFERTVSLMTIGQQEVFQMYYIDCKSMKEVSKETGKSITATKASLRRIRQFCKLRHCS